MSPNDHLSSFDASFSDSFSEDLIRQFEHKTEAIRSALNEEEPPTPPTPQPQQEHDQLPPPPPSPKEVEKEEPPTVVEDDEEEQQVEPQPKLAVIVPERELKPSRSRFFRSPKKMKSLSRLFTTVKEEEEPELPKVVSPWSATTTQNSSPSSTIFGNICQYPPRPLQYSSEISPPSEIDDELALNARRSCTLKPTAPEPSEQRRSSAPALPPRPTGKHRVFAFLWPK